MNRLRTATALILVAFSLAFSWNAYPTDPPFNLIGITEDSLLELQVKAYPFCVVSLSHSTGFNDTIFYYGLRSYGASDSAYVAMWANNIFNDTFPDSSYTLYLKLTPHNFISSDTLLVYEMCLPPPCLLGRDTHFHKTDTIFAYTIPIIATTSSLSLTKTTSKNILPTYNSKRILVNGRVSKYQAFQIVYRNGVLTSQGTK